MALRNLAAVLADWRDLRDNILPGLEADGLGSQALNAALTLSSTGGSGGGGATNVTVQNFPATQPVFAAALPLPTGAATEVTLASVLAQLQGDRAISAQQFIDSTNTVYLKVLAFNTTTNVYESVSLNFNGSSYTPVLPEQPLSKNDSDTTETIWEITGAGTGVSTGDIVSQFTLISQGPPIAVLGVLWFNQSTGLALAGAPVIGIRRRVGTVSATESTLATRLSEGTPIIGETIPSGSGFVGWTSSIRQRLDSLLLRFPATLGAKPSATSFSVSIASDDAQFGVKSTAATLPAGGTGLLGWVSDTYRLTLSSFTASTAPFFRPTDGINNLTIKAASTAPLAADTAAVVSLNPLGNAIRLGLIDYVPSAGNNTSNQLAATTTFVGAVESTLNHPQILLSVRCDTSYRLFIQQFSDAAGTITVAPDIIYSREAGVPFSQSINIISSYFRVQVQNTNTVTPTTNLFVETWLGILPPLPNADNRGALPVSTPKKVLIQGPTYGATAPDNVAIPNALNTVKLDATPTDVSEFGCMVIYFTCANTGRDFTLTGSWQSTASFFHNLPMEDMALPLNPPLFGAQPTTTTFNKAYYVDLQGVNFITLSVLAASQVCRARVVCYTQPFGHKNGAVNLSQVAGVAVSVGSGAVGTGTLRTVPAQLPILIAGAVPQVTSDYALGATARIRKLKVLNENASVVYVGIYSSAGALTAASVPLNGLVWRVPANSDFLLSVGDLGDSGTSYGATTRIGVSSTRNLYTALTAPQLAASALHVESV